MLRLFKKYRFVFAAVGVLVLIFDTKNAQIGAKEGIELCLHTIIPSLFPLIFLTGLLNQSISERSKIVIYMEKFLHLPVGSGSIWLLGSMSGYPVGAQLIANRIKENRLDRSEVNDLLIFCNNPGPAFIFGVVGTLFKNSIIPLALWLIQLVSSLILGVILPHNAAQLKESPSNSDLSFRDHLNKAITAISNICGWIILFRILQYVLDSRFMTMIPQTIRCVIYGILELSNGCTSLGRIENLGFRFLCCAALLSFGGLCVGFQTASTLPVADMFSYYRGKLLQSCISLMLAILIQPLLFTPQEQINISYLTAAAICFLSIILYWSIYRKIVVEKKKTMVYNQEKAKMRCA